MTVKFPQCYQYLILNPIKKNLRAVIKSKGLVDNAKPQTKVVLVLINWDKENSGFVVCSYYLLTPNLEFRGM